MHFKFFKKAFKTYSLYYIMSPPPMLPPSTCSPHLQKEPERERERDSRERERERQGETEREW